ncbi:TPA: phage scaffolding protein [Streptococcus pneumoniae]|nr:methyl-accepting chemotaxis protein scaffolding protein [Streptococcus pneumoniae]
MKRDFLVGLGLSDDVINQIMVEHGKSVQGVQSKLDEAESKLEEANSTLDTLKQSNKDNEDLQNELKTYKEKVSQLEADAKETTKKQTIKDALADVKATDVDYLMYKLGDVELADDGSIKDLISKSYRNQQRVGWKLTVS